MGSEVVKPGALFLICQEPVEDGPNSFDRSTRIVSIVPSTVISTFFMMMHVLLSLIVLRPAGL